MTTRRHFIAAAAASLLAAPAVAQQVVRIPRDWVLPLFVLTVAVFGLVVSFPFEAMGLASLVYLCTIPLSVARFQAMRREHAALQQAATAPAEAGIGGPPTESQADGR